MGKEKDQFVQIVKDFQRDFPRLKNRPANTLFRDYKEINQSRKIYYLCCAERNHVVAHRAATEGLSPTGLLLGIKRFGHPAKVGTAMELTLDGITYTFSSINSGDSLNPGIIELGKKFYQIERAEISPNQERNWFEHFRIRSMDDIERKFPGFNSSLALTLERRQKSDGNYQRHMRKIQANKLKPTYI